MPRSRSASSCGSSTASPRTQDRDRTQGGRASSGSVLTTIDGLGVIGVARIIAAVGDPARFRSGAALAAYVGAVPATNRSGLWAARRPGLSRLGNARLRRALYMTILGAAGRRTTARSTSPPTEGATETSTPRRARAREPSSSCTRGAGGMGCRASRPTARRAGSSRGTVSRTRATTSTGSTSREPGSPGRPPDALERARPRDLSRWALAPLQLRRVGPGRGVRPVVGEERPQVADLDGRR